MSEENKRVVRRYFEELDRRKATPVDLCADRFTFKRIRDPRIKHPERLLDVRR